MSALSELCSLLETRPLSEDRFEAVAIDPGWGRLYGGQVVAQALSAAQQTVPEHRFVHSLHSYFLEKGRVDTPIVLVVERLRDGRSFHARRVTALQDQVPILTLSASFQGTETGLEHGPDMPPSPDPRTLPARQVLSRRALSRLPEGVVRRLEADSPFEIRPTVAHDPTRPTIQPAHRQTWYRATDLLPDDPALHRRLLAWAADSHFLTTVSQPHGVSWLTPGISVASIDHAMWFHRPVRVDQWLLYDVQGPTLSGSRGLVTGRFFTEQGVLVASTTQEGLVRDTRA